MGATHCWLNIIVNGDIFVNGGHAASHSTVSWHHLTPKRVEYDIEPSSFFFIPKSQKYSDASWTGAHAACGPTRGESDSHPPLSFIFFRDDARTRSYSYFFFSSYSLFYHHKRVLQNDNNDLTCRWKRLPLRVSSNGTKMLFLSFTIYFNKNFCVLGRHAVFLFFILYMYKRRKIYMYIVKCQTQLRFTINTTAAVTVKNKFLQKYHVFLNKNIYTFESFFGT